MKRWFFLLMVSACGDNKHPGTQPQVDGGSDATVVDAPADAMVDAAPPQMGTVTVIALDHHLTEAGDVTAANSNLRVIDSADNVIIPGPGTNGTFQFVSVAPGAYLLCDVGFVTRTHCVQSTAATIDFSRYVAGRPGMAVGATGTQLALTLNGLTPGTGPNEFLDIRTLNTNYIEYPAPPLVGMSLMQTLDFRLLGLLAPTDVLRATQLVTKTSGTETYVAAVRSGEVTGVTMTDGASTAVTVPLSTTLAQNTTRTFNLRRSQFNSIAGSPGPGWTFHNVDINGYSEARPYDWQPWVFYYSGTGAGNTDLPLTISYGDPTPTAYVDTFEAAFWFERSITATGATTPTVVVDYLATYRPSSELTGDITPKLSRVTDVKINGLDATTTHTGTTTTPTVTWTAPSLGTATSYTLYVYRVINSNGSTIVTVDGDFTTTNTSFRIPPGYINAGEQYLIGVRAQNYEGYNSTKPNARPDRYDLADTTSEMQTP